MTYRESRLAVYGDCAAEETPNWFALTYFSIPITLVYFICERRDGTFN
jgi:hypothetical protein